MGIFAGSAPGRFQCAGGLGLPQIDEPPANPACPAPPVRGSGWPADRRDSGRSRSGPSGAGKHRVRERRGSEQPLSLKAPAQALGRWAKSKSFSLVACSPHHALSRLTTYFGEFCSQFALAAFAAAGVTRANSSASRRSLRRASSGSPAGHRSSVPDRSSPARWIHRASR